MEKKEEDNRENSEENNEEIKKKDERRRKRAANYKEEMEVDFLFDPFHGIVLFFGLYLMILAYTNWFPIKEASSLPTSTEQWKPKLPSQIKLNEMVRDSKKQSATSPNKRIQHRPENNIINNNTSVMKKDISNLKETEKEMTSSSILQDDQHSQMITMDDEDDVSVRSDPLDIFRQFSKESKEEESANDLLDSKFPPEKEEEIIPKEINIQDDEPIIKEEKEDIPKEEKESEKKLKKNQAEILKMKQQHVTKNDQQTSLNSNNDNNNNKEIVIGSIVGFTISVIIIRALRS